MRSKKRLRFTPVVFALLCIADCRPPSEDQAPASSVVQIPVPEASFRVTFGLKDREPQTWNGRLLPQQGQTVQVEPDLLREHNYQASEEPKFPNDYVRDGRSWVCSTRPAWMRDPDDFELELPSLLLQLWRNPGNAPLHLETDNGEIRFQPADLKPFQPVFFLDGAVRIEVVPSVFSPVQTTTGQQDYPAVLARKGGELWTAWQEYGEESESVYVRKRVDGSWEKPIRLVEGADVFRTALGEDASGRVWAVWAMQVEGNWDLYGRAFDGSSWTSLERLTQNKGSDIFHRVFRDSEDRLWLVWQATMDGMSQIVGKHFDGSQWSSRVQISDGPAGAGNNWWPTAAAGKDRSIAVGWDGYASGSYDVYVRRMDSGKWGPVRGLASTQRFEANPSLSFDEKNRLWVVWQESSVEWGKDTGRLATRVGTQLHESRWLRVVCLEGEKILRPVGSLAEILPGDQWELPHFEVGPGGQPWLFVRKMTLRQPDTREVRGKLGPAYFPRWDIYATRYQDAAWTEPMYLPRSSGRNDMMPQSSLDPEGGFWLAWATDSRNTKSYMQQQNRVMMTRFEVPSTAGQPRLEAYKPGPVPSFDPIHENETEQTRQIQSYRIETGSKTYSIYRGDLHRHTDISVDGGGDGSLLDAYRYARDAAQLDFLGITDHTDHVAESYTWWRSQKFADLFQQDKFVAFYSYERSALFPNGHRNIIFVERGRPVLPILGQENRGLEGAERLFWYLRRYDGTSIPHTSVGGGGTDWRDNDPQVEHLVEIYQGLRDTYEHPGAPRPKTLQPAPGVRKPGHVWNALRKGYKLGFIASSDHFSTHMSYACLLAESLTRESLMEAIRARRAYAATDNIIMDIRYFGSDGEHLMGEEFVSSAPLRIKATIMGTDTIARIDVIKDEKIVYQVSPKQSRVDFEFLDGADLGSETSYYYLRVLQQDGELAWASPVWVDYSPNN